MITIDSVLSKKNIEAAFAHFAIKQNGGGTDRREPSELMDYWKQNSDRICDEIRECSYNPGLIMEYEIINGKGKKRIVTKFNDLDKLITRLLAQKLGEFYGSMFLDKSCAYQQDKGVLKATDIARCYIEEGREFAVEIDIEHFFDEINLERMYGLVEKDIKDQAVLHLIKEYLYCAVSNDGIVRQQKKGVLQGSSMSPVFSNLYLHALDEYMEEKEYCWVRFADDISVYAESEEEGERIYNDLCSVIRQSFLLPINEHKSGVYDAYERRYLGYDFRKRGKRVIVSRHSYKKQGYYHKWHPCVVEKINREYHIAQGGILNKKDYALLFENDEEKHHIPVESTEQINLYNEVTLTSAVLRTLAYEDIRLGIYDIYGDLLGYFTPQSHKTDSKILLEQCERYNDEKEHLKIARQMEIAAIHNIRSNIRYYNKKQGGALDDVEEYLTQEMKKMSGATSIDELLLIEARCRQKYYQTFNNVIGKDDFYFEKRTKRPPMDAINALISFGNTLLYNRVQQKIWKTSLDSRIGIFHAANKRNCSLNLDFADLFKPLTVDRVIFTILNRGQIRRTDFEDRENGAVYLSSSGKRTFIEVFEEKMASRLSVKGKPMSYDRLIENEIYAYLAYIKSGEKYKPYKYY